MKVHVPRSSAVFIENAGSLIPTLLSKELLLELSPDELTGRLMFRRKQPTGRSRAED